MADSATHSATNPNVEFRAGQGKTNVPFPTARQNIVQGWRTKRPATNRLTDAQDDSARHLYFVKDAAGFHESQLGSLDGVPTVRVRIAGFPALL